MRAVLALVFAASVASFVTMADASVARAWSCGVAGCARWCEAPSYRLGRLSSDLEDFAPGTTVTEVNRAMNDWTLVSCTALESSYAGRTNTNAVSGDGLSEIDFVDTDWPLDANIIGATTWIYAGACLVESDILMNSVNYDFVTNPGYLGDVNTYSAILHEAGHFYGLGHSSLATSTMYFRYGIGTLELRYDDHQGVCSLYPGEDPPPDCATRGCPTGQMCTGGVCVDAPTPPCENDQDCISIFVCNLGTGKCEPPGDAAGTLGSACTTDADCSSSLCHPTAAGTICSSTCDASNPRSCPFGFHCSGQAVGDCAVGVCLPGTTGPGAFGSACDAATDCASLFCGNGACSVPCERGVEGGCPSTFVCHPSDVGACGVCGTPTVLGGLCQTSDECASGICFDAETDGRGFCTTNCDESSPCPDELRCTSVGDESICAPTGRIEGGLSCAVVAGAHVDAPGLLGWIAMIGVTLRLRRATKRR